MDFPRGMSSRRVADQTVGRGFRFLVRVIPGISMGLGLDGGILSVSKRGLVLNRGGAGTGAGWARLESQGLNPLTQKERRA